ncbi:winged helix-turn-helix transcriptional regulator [Chitinophaga niabensis]|uniref:DNA-binding transcriptional regulator, HxlR family n=1 Tax=Chitinophaga niabensis TaxID=536979 RepID=A0A1N6D362_9BACT|nr:helix-turn-helix domain-containing protein [Chitinophaga niabensis]SIN65270.1 DNA-binding transcriptional regulator, HxlR family [Chitinophaga niabensis]
MKEEILIYPPALCPFALTVQIIGGKWKPLILHLVSSGANRFSLLEKHLPGISRKMLANQLREMEKDGLLTREIFAEVPPRVEYSLTEMGTSLLIAVEPMLKWGEKYLTPQYKRHTALHS